LGDGLAAGDHDAARELSDIAIAHAQTAV
jgi:hypothetical protein